MKLKHQAREILEAIINDPDNNTGRDINGLVSICAELIQRIEELEAKTNKP